MNIIDKDVDFLKKHNLMDYSLLLAIERTDINRSNTLLPTSSLNTENKEIIKNINMQWKSGSVFVRAES